LYYFTDGHRARVVKIFFFLLHGLVFGQTPALAVVETVSDNPTLFNNPPSHCLKKKIFLNSWALREPLDGLLFFFDMMKKIFLNSYPCLNRFVLRTVVPDNKKEKVHHFV